MKPTTILAAAAVILTACQIIPEKSAPVEAASPARTIPERSQVREAQAGLKQLGYYRSRVDGIEGPRTSAAVQRSRADLGLKPGSMIDRELLDIMTRYLALNPPQKGIPSPADVFTAQRGLKRLGYYDGQVNGLYDSATVAAVLDYRRRNRLAITEKLDAKLLRRIETDSTPAATG